MIDTVSYTGCIPNAENPKMLADIRLKEVPWDASTQPPVSSWESFHEFLMTQPDQVKNWWEFLNVDCLFTKSQEFRPNCAGFAMANAAMCSILSQTLNRFSEQFPKRFNPMVTWQKSKGGSVRGGQTIAAMAVAGNEIGNYISEDVGTYDPYKTFTSTQSDEDLHAKNHQIGYCLYDGNSPAEAILLACQKGFACFVGNSRAVSGCGVDSEGVWCAQLGGSWAHATAFAGFKVVNGKKYVFWINSHGGIYASDDGTPDFGCWMSESQLNIFMSSTFNDLCLVTYCEADYNPNTLKTLNPTKS